MTFSALRWGIQEESTHEMVSLFSASILAGPIGGPGIPPIIMMLI
jgi:hypothetical protein